MMLLDYCAIGYLCAEHGTRGTEESAPHDLHGVSTSVHRFVIESPNIFTTQTGIPSLRLQYSTLELGAARRL